jgi:WD40 repeat protein
MQKVFIGLTAALAIAISSDLARAGGAPPDVTLAGHTGRINSVAFSPDGKRLASVSDDGHLKIWDLATGHEQFDAEDAAPNRNVVRFSADGGTVVAIGSDKNVLVIDVAAGKQRAPIALANMTGSATGLDVSPDGKTLAVVGRGTLRLFDLSTGAAKGAYEVHKSYEAAAVAFSPDRSTLATVGSDNTALIIDPASGKALKTFDIVHHGLAVAFSRDGKNLYTYGDDKVLRSFDIASGEVSKLMNDGTPLSTIAVSSDGKTLVLGDSAHGPLLMSLPLGIRLGEEYAGDDRVTAACISPDDQWIAGGANEGAIYVWKWKH